MIRLRKGPAPGVLVEKAAEWTREFLDAVRDTSRMTDAVRFRYRRRDIKDALRRECHNKCVYCEGPVEFGQTDHIHPVSRCPEQVVAWNNLALVCTECNTFKGDYYAPAEPLINPFVDDPADHLLFLGTLVHESPGDAMGFRTHTRLRLNRAALLQRRLIRLNQLRPLVHQWKTHPEGETRALLWAELVAEAGDAKEFAAAVRGYLEHVVGWKWPGDPPPNDTAVATSG